MSSPGDMSIRPTPPAELPAIARVADRDEKRRHEQRPQAQRKEPRAKDQTGDEPNREGPPRAGLRGRNLRTAPDASPVRVV